MYGNCAPPIRRLEDRNTYMTWLPTRTRQQCLQRWLRASLTSVLPDAVNSCSAWDWRRCPKTFTANYNSPGPSSRGHAWSNTDRACIPNHMRRNGLHASRLARTAHMCRREHSRLRSEGLYRTTAVLAATAVPASPATTWHMNGRYAQNKHQKEQALQDQTTHLLNFRWMTK